MSLLGASSGPGPHPPKRGSPSKCITCGAPARSYWTMALTESSIGSITKGFGPRKGTENLVASSKCVGATSEVRQGWGWLAARWCNWASLDRGQEPVRRGAASEKLNGIGPQPTDSLHRPQPRWYTRQTGTSDRGEQLASANQTMQALVNAHNNTRYGAIKKAV
jgi:hypothetical protein